MDPNIQRALTDKLYDKRKSGALELEGLIRDSLAANDHDRISRIVNQLCHDYAYQVHQPHARNGGLIGLAAAAIALGPAVVSYLEEIVPPVLACFSDQDARVRYYACESMYNIAKVAKGEILVYFNEVFDALTKLAADSELSVKNGAELLDRLIKDIVSESAASYVSVLHTQEEKDDSPHRGKDSAGPPTAFSLARFIPLLKERITVMNPFTRVFLVTWITLLDSIPDLELVTYLPDFLGGIFKFLSDNNQDVHTATQVALDRFLSEIKKIARLKRGLAESKRSQVGVGIKRTESTSRSEISRRSSRSVGSDAPSGEARKRTSLDVDDSFDSEDASSAGGDDASIAEVEEDWIPGQDVFVDHARILDILVTFLGGSSEQEIKVTALKWIDNFFEIAPEEILSFIPRLLSQMLPALSNDDEQVRAAASRVNNSLMEYILSLPDEDSKAESAGAPQLPVPRDSTSSERRESATPSHIPRPSIDGSTLSRSPTEKTALVTTDGQVSPPNEAWNLDYEATINSLTLQFLNENEATRVAALNWLIMLHRKSPPARKLDINDGTFPALLKTLSDASDAVVRQDLILLCQMFKNTEDAKFSSFMVQIIKLFATDRRLLETRGNLIIRQLCLSLSAERIYRTLADCLDKDEDVEFASIMVQNLNNNLITAPELADLRKRLRNLDSRDGQTFFVTLFKSWCHNAVATFSLCLLAQAYEQAYNLLQIFADLEMTVNMLIQIDKLVQLLESPVFTYLRLQLLEPERYPFLYKCLYGLLMLLPQSSAFAALKNRLNSVSAIGYLHIANYSTAAGSSVGTPRTYVFSQVSNLNQQQQWLDFGSQASPFSYVPASSILPRRSLSPPRSPFLPPRSQAHILSDTSRQPSSIASTSSVVSNFERPNRLKAREDSNVRWVELLEKFRSTQEKARKQSRGAGATGEDGEDSAPPPVPDKEHAGIAAVDQARGAGVGIGQRALPRAGTPTGLMGGIGVPGMGQQPKPVAKTKVGLGFGKFGGGGSKKDKKK